MRLRILVLSIIVPSMIVSAQSIVGARTPDAYQVHYFANANVGLGDQYIDITNSGAGGARLVAGTDANIAGTICVNAYVFASDEELIACCSCPVTPNGVTELSVNQDLLINILEPQLPARFIVVALTATKPLGANSAGCAGSSFTSIPEDTAAGNSVLVPGMVAWGTAIHANTSRTVVFYQLTETRFEPKPLLDQEAFRMTALCSISIGNSGGAGICNTCKVGGLAASKQ
jgi:hypothetical protein